MGSIDLGHILMHF